jgi:ribonucleoside-diphosphate reductase alpha chain
MIDQPQDQLHLHGIDPLQGRKLCICKRDGRIEEFNEARIGLAIESAFRAVHDLGRDVPLPFPLDLNVRKCTDAVVERVLARAIRGEQMEVERIQDTVEDQLMMDGHLAVARAYILYREKRRLARAQREGRVLTTTSTGSKVPAPFPPFAPPAPARPIAAPVAPPALPAPEPAPESSVLREIYRQALPHLRDESDLTSLHRDFFSIYISDAQYRNQLAPELAEFDLPFLADALRLERDQLFTPSGLATLRDEFLLHDHGLCQETPQYFWMRIAMGLALNEGPQRNLRAVEFYEVLSTVRFLPSETILARAGTIAPALLEFASATSQHDLEHVRVIPAAGPGRVTKQPVTCSWLEPWHLGIREFLSRTRPGGPVWNQDLNKALWVPDLFMKRVRAQECWTLFEPAAVPGLHQSFGRAFEELYAEYEQKAEHGEITAYQRVDAAALWLEIMESLAETGQPWLGFKDAVNIRSAQDHAGTIQSAGIRHATLLPTGPFEAAACPGGSIHFRAHLAEGKPTLDLPALGATVSSALRMLDNALDLSAYPDDAARHAAQSHRSVALGVIGYAETLQAAGIPFSGAAAAGFADRSLEMMSRCAIVASCELARERGTYATYPGSKWHLGLLPHETLPLLSAERGLVVDTDYAAALDWEPVRAELARWGMRHGATTAILPAETVSRLAGVSPSTEPGPAGTTPAASTLQPQWLIECAARRQKWLDMGQAFTLYTTDVAPAALSEILMQAWEKGLKTTGQVRALPRPAAPAPPPPTVEKKKRAARETTRSTPAKTAPVAVK